jgi:hypothetical protein
MNYDDHCINLGRLWGDLQYLEVTLRIFLTQANPTKNYVTSLDTLGPLVGEYNGQLSVVAQLAKPAVEPSPVALLTKGFKYELLTWVGIVGGALTLFTHMSSVLKLADWARLLVQGWKDWTHAFWVWVFGWLGIHLPPYWAPMLSFLLFWSLLTVGQAINSRSTINRERFIDRYQGSSFRFMSYQTVFTVAGIVVATSILSLFMWLFPMRIEGPATYIPSTVVYIIPIVLKY